MDWNDFAKRLTLELSRLPVTSFLIVQGPSGLPYVQAMRAEGVLDAEAVSSAFMPRPLAPRQERRLRALGWEPPDEEERKNWWHQFTLRDRGDRASAEHLEACALLAGLMVGAFRDVYRIESPLELVYQASRSGPDGGPLALPGLGIPLAVPETEGRPASARPARPSGSTLETALAEARERGDQHGYLELLARAVLYLPAPGDPGAAEHQFATAQFGDGTFVLAFTSPEAMDRSLQGQAVHHRQVSLSELSRRWPHPDWQLAINPGLPSASYLDANALFEPEESRRPPTPPVPSDVHVAGASARTKTSGVGPSRRSSAAGGSGQPAREVPSTGGRAPRPPESPAPARAASPAPSGVPAPAQTATRPPDGAGTPPPPDGSATPRPADGSGMPHSQGGSGMPRPLGESQAPRPPVETRTTSPLPAESVTPRPPEDSKTPGPLGESRIPHPPDDFRAPRPPRDSRTPRPPVPPSPRRSEKPSAREVPGGPRGVAASGRGGSPNPSRETPSDPQGLPVSPAYGRREAAGSAHRLQAPVPQPRTEPSAPAPTAPDAHPGTTQRDPVAPPAQQGQEPADGASQVVMMQKVVRHEHVQHYLEGGYDLVAGYVHRVQDVREMTPPAALIRGLGLVYEGSPFTPTDEEIHMIRWPAVKPPLFRRPLGGIDEWSMGIIPGGWVIEKAPFPGSGYAPGDGPAIPEFKIESQRLPHGAELYRVTAGGTETLVASYDADLRRWMVKLPARHGGRG